MAELGNPTQPGIPLTPALVGKDALWGVWKAHNAGMRVPDPLAAVRLQPSCCMPKLAPLFADYSPHFNALILTCSSCNSSFLIVVVGDDPKPVKIDIVPGLGPLGVKG